MLEAGDTVKIISVTQEGEDKKEYIPIGTICKVVEVCMDNEKPYYGVSPISDSIPSIPSVPFYYLENEIEKGHLEWVKD